jgi:hypothetical protein
VSIFWGQGAAKAFNARVIVPLCSDGTTTADVSFFSFYLYMDGPTYTPGKDLAYFDGPNMPGYTLMSPVSKKWTKVTGTFQTDSAYDFGIYFNPGAPWAGTVYVDQVQFTQ